MNASINTFSATLYQLSAPLLTGLALIKMVSVNEVLLKKTKARFIQCCSIEGTGWYILLNKNSYFFSVTITSGSWIFKLSSPWKETKTCYLFNYRIKKKCKALIRRHISHDALHYNAVILGAMASQITSLAIVYSTVYSGAVQRKHRWPVNSPHKW